MNTDISKVYLCSEESVVNELHIAASVNIFLCLCKVKEKQDWKMDHCEYKQ